MLHIGNLFDFLICLFNQLRLLIGDYQIIDAYWLEAGKPALIDFYADWCGPCRQEMPNVKRVYKKYSKEGFESVGISLDQRKDQVESYLKKIEEQPAASSSSAKLGNVIARLNGKVIKQFLPTINIEDLAKAIKDMEGKVQIKLFNLLPERGASLLLESVEQMDSIGPGEILEAQNKVVAIISELRDQGRIG